MARAFIAGVAVLVIPCLAGLVILIVDFNSNDKLKVERLATPLTPLSHIVTELNRLGIKHTVAKKPWSQEVDISLDKDYLVKMIFSGDPQHSEPILRRAWVEDSNGEITKWICNSR